MAYLLRFLNILMVLLIGLSALAALSGLPLPISHIQLAIASFLYLIFAQSFIMFYFIGVSRLVGNVHSILTSKTKLEELFETPPKNLAPYLKKVEQFLHETTLSKRKVIPWTMLMLVLGMFAFLLGGAYDTGLVSKTTHSGVSYGFISAMLIGFFRQWIYLGKNHRTLRKLKSLFSLSDQAM